jgi:ribosomal protein S18 acetylase RimI-like enzyme
MLIQYRINTSLSAENLAALFDNSDIQRPTTDLNRIQRMIDNANLTITAWDEEKLVGVARALTDFVWCCYLSDLAVDREYQHQGIGRELIRQVQLALVTEEATLLLLSAPEAMSYYPKIGLTAVQNGWMVKRTQ